MLIMLRDAASAPETGGSPGPTNTVTITPGEAGGGSYAGYSDGTGTGFGASDFAWGTASDTSFGGQTLALFSMNASGRLRMAVSGHAQIPGINDLTVTLPGDYGGAPIVCSWNGTGYQSGVIAAAGTYMDSKVDVPITIAIDQS